MSQSSAHPVKATWSIKTTVNKTGKQESRESNIVIEKQPQQHPDGKIRKETAKEGEKLPVIKETKRLADVETSREREESHSKLAGLSLPEFTRVMVTKLSRNVTQVGSLCP